MGEVHRRQAESAWEGVEVEQYPDMEGVEKHDLVSADAFTVRYFHLEPGSRTRRERHSHEHGVVIQQGRARVTLGDRQVEVGPGDSLHVPGGEVHCFEAVGDRALGFVCVVGTELGESEPVPE